ncbi:MAG: N-acetyl-alpha-D-glucosaminyl L-malate synthase BshA [Firmicutes bacterium]|nr:N-acetyl-alpha-D-glucosaminyl L-malate synthase BshA [Bacillota bacterium]
MNIAMVCYPTHGGSGVVASELGKQLAALGHGVHFLSYELPFRLAGFIENMAYHEVEVAPYPLFRYPPYSLALASRLADLIKEAGLDIIHSHYAIPHAVSAHLAKEAAGASRVATVTTLHGTDIMLVGSSSSLYTLTRFSMEKSGALTAVSQSLREQTLETFGLEREIHVIPNFIDPEEFQRREQPGLRDRLAPPEARILVYVSNFRPVKRAVDAVKIFHQISREIPAKLLMIGDGVERAAAAKTASRLGLKDQVLFLGQQDNVVPLLSAADLILVPSELESFGLAALEAMACQVPVIASRVGGLPEVVADGETGYLAPVGDVEEMARLSLELLTDPELHRRFAMAARQRAVGLFSPDQVLPQYLEVYEKLLTTGV